MAKCYNEVLVEYRKEKEREEKYNFVLVVSSQRGEAGTQEKDEKAGEHLQRQREVKKIQI